MTDPFSAPPQRRVRCREIVDDDIEAVANLLARGFPERVRACWALGLERQRARKRTDHYPRYGYLLESEAGPVGVILMLCGSFGPDGGGAMRCNLSSWYVEPAFRGHASLLISHALRHKNVTYVNISPRRHTWPIIEAQGFSCYSAGQFLALAALNRREPGATLIEVKPGQAPLSIPEADLLEAHASFGCLSVLCTEGDVPSPFVFQRFRITRGPISLTGAQLVYCRSTESFVRFAGLIGRFLLRRGILFVAVDANGPIEGLTGMFHTRRRKYFKGPAPPRLGDLAFTEMAIFGP
jgi:hypothetical protein